MFIKQYTKKTTPSCLACSCFFEGIPLGDMDQAREKGRVSPASSFRKCANLVDLQVWSYMFTTAKPACEESPDGETTKKIPTPFYECKCIGIMKLPMLEGQPMHVYGHFEGFVPRTHCFGWQYIRSSEVGGSLQMI